MEHQIDRELSPSLIHYETQASIWNSESFDDSSFDGAPSCAVSEPQDAFIWGGGAEHLALSNDLASPAPRRDDISTYINGRILQLDNSVVGHGGSLEALNFPPTTPWNPEFSMGATSIQEQSILGAHDHMPGWPSELNVSTQASSGGRLVLHPPQDVMVVDASSPEDSSEDEPTNNVAQIGIVLANGKYKCNLLECAHKKFSRPAELRRHHDTIHAALKPEFWCRVPFCPRSAAAGGKAFRRKYRLQDHMRKLHNGGGSGGRVGLTEDANEDVSGDLEEWAICC